MLPTLTVRRRDSGAVVVPPGRAGEVTQKALPRLPLGRSSDRLLTQDPLALDEWLRANEGEWEVAERPRVGVPTLETEDAIERQFEKGTRLGGGFNSPPLACPRRIHDTRIDDGLQIRSGGSGLLSQFHAHAHARRAEGANVREPPPRGVRV